ncbi:MAG TPA: UDP-N-acetylmuramoyl-L-alanine--D-glutamate ligase [Xanthobacteraceae bacterium]|nr:UDP-N-acetylmuramoyl-L-alanine--D-glutamate ligase [Xanthobacteraceae bacterium]
MTPVTTFRGKTVAVFGLGASGIATAQALIAGGANVIAWDDTPKSVEKARAEGIETQDLREIGWNGVAALVLAPGVPLTHPVPHWSVGLARNAAVEVIGDIELFCRERKAIAPNAPFVAITGTNGKSTTTSLIAHILQSAGREVALGGNLGTPILALPSPSMARVHVIECSSFQIDLAPSLNPSVGVLLNLSPDHIDRHGTFENYAGVKARLISGVQPGGTAVIGVDDNLSAAIADRAERAGTRVVRVSMRRPLSDGIFLDGERVTFAQGGANLFAAALTGIGSLRGTHNAQNAACAFAAANALGISYEQIAAALKSFPGLAHRMEEVARRGNVLFINDSKATNADAAARALASFTEIFWIAGGKPKEGGLAGLEGYFPRVKKAYLIGESAEAFSRQLGAVPHVISGTLDRALTEAAKDAEAANLQHPVVLLSPACASYDQFPNFEVRGDTFRSLVLSMLR